MGKDDNAKKIKGFFKGLVEKAKDGISEMKENLQKELFEKNEKPKLDKSIELFLKNKEYKEMILLFESKPIMESYPDYIIKYLRSLYMNNEDEKCIERGRYFLDKYSDNKKINWYLFRAYRTVGEKEKDFDKIKLSLSSFNNYYNSKYGVVADLKYKEEIVEAVAEIFEKMDNENSYSLIVSEYENLPDYLSVSNKKASILYIRSLYRLEDYEKCIKNGNEFCHDYPDKINSLSYFIGSSYYCLFLKNKRYEDLVDCLKIRKSRAMNNDDDTKDEYENAIAWYSNLIENNYKEEKYDLLLTRIETDFIEIHEPTSKIAACYLEAALFKTKPGKDRLKLVFTLLNRNTTMLEHNKFSSKASFYEGVLERNIGKIDNSIKVLRTLLEKKDLNELTITFENAKNEITNSFNKAHSEEKWSEVIDCFELKILPNQKYFTDFEEQVPKYLNALYRNSGTEDKCIEQTLLYIEKFPKKVEWNRYPALVYSWRGDKSKNIELLKKASDYYKKAGNSEKEKEEIANIEKLKNEFTDELINKVTEEKWSEAIECFELKILPNQKYFTDFEEQVPKYLNALYRNSGTEDKCIEQTLLLIEKFPKKVEWYEYPALVYKWRGNSSKNFEIIGKAIEYYKKYKKNNIEDLVALLKGKIVEEFLQNEKDEKWTEVVECFEKNILKNEIHFGSITDYITKYLNALYRKSGSEEKCINQSLIFIEKFPKNLNWYEFAIKASESLGKEKKDLSYIHKAIDYSILSIASKEKITLLKELEKRIKIQITDENKQKTLQTKEEERRLKEDEKKRHAGQVANEKKKLAEVKANEKKAAVEEKKRIAEEKKSERSVKEDDKLKQHRFKNSRGETICQYCGYSDRYREDPCEGRINGHNYVHVKDKWGNWELKCNKCGYSVRYRKDPCT